MLPNIPAVARAEASAGSQKPLSRFTLSLHVGTNRIAGFNMRLSPLTAFILTCGFAASVEAQTQPNRPAQPQQPRVEQPRTPLPTDTAGVRLGMTLEEAKAALQAYNPNMVVQEHRRPRYPNLGSDEQYVAFLIAQDVVRRPRQEQPASNPGSMAGAMAQMFSNRGFEAPSQFQRVNESFTLYFLPSDGNRLYAMTRSVLFPDDNRPALENVDRGLVEKYGRVMVERTRTQERIQSVWVSGQDGAAVAASSPVAQCRFAGGAGAGTDFGRMASGGETGASIQMRLQPNCGARIEANVEGVEGSPGIARGVSIGLTDVALAVVEHTKHQREEQALIARRNQQQIDDARNRQPSVRF